MVIASQRTVRFCARPVIALVLSFAMVSTWAASISVQNGWRTLSASDPHGLIVQGHAALASEKYRADANDERELLWWMGHAAINLSDHATLLEVVLRLDGVNTLNGDALAAAYAGFLRADDKIVRGDSGGVSLALLAASLLQDSSDPASRALAQFQLCDAYTMSGNDTRALPLCRTAAAGFEALGDEWNVAQCENNIGALLANQGQRDEAVATYLQAQARYTELGDVSQAVMVGDNLARVYLEMGRYVEALRLSRASYANERAAGRINDALLSRANIARAYAHLGDLRAARREIDQAVAEARNTHNDGILSDLLETRSAVAESSGDLKSALQSERDLVKTRDAQNASNVQAEQNELEVRYAARENELRIRDLERDNRLKDLELKAAKDAAQQREDRENSQRRLLLTIVIAAFGLVLVIVLLALLLRTQRRHAAHLQMQTLRDPLTGAENRRGFFARIKTLLKVPQRSVDPAHALLLIDLDHFKQVNDKYGHPFGDQVLARVADCMREVHGPDASMARLGGEEFAILYPCIGAAAALALAERTRKAVADLHFAERAPGMQVTVSIGVAMFDGVHNHDVDSWMRSADTALYRGKGQGRDRVVACDETIPVSIARLNRGERNSGL